VKTAADFFVAGRRLGPGLLFSTMLAANIGAGSTVGRRAWLSRRDRRLVVGWVGRHRLARARIHRRAAHLAGLVAARPAHGGRLPRPPLFAARERQRVGAALGRHSRDPRGQLIALAWVLNVVAGVPKTAGCLIGGLVMTTYFVAGGLLASAWINLLQLVVLLAGFALALPSALQDVGGWQGLGTARPRFPATGLGPERALRVDLPRHARPRVRRLARAAAEGLRARDERAVRLGVGANAVGLLLFAAVPPVLGMVSRVLHPGLANHELALPALLRYDVRRSSGASAWPRCSPPRSARPTRSCSCGHVAVADLYKRFVNPGATDAQVLRWHERRPSGRRVRRGTRGGVADGDRRAERLLQRCSA